MEILASRFSIQNVGIINGSGIRREEEKISLSYMKKEQKIKKTSTHTPTTQAIQPISESGRQPEPVVPLRDFGLVFTVSAYFSELRPRTAHSKSGGGGM